MSDLLLAEGGQPEVLARDDSTGDALTASAVVEAHRLGGGFWQVTPLTKVGVVTIGDLTVWVRPKVDVRRILFLIGYAHDAGWRTDGVDLLPVSDLVPALARAFADPGRAGR